MFLAAVRAALGAAALAAAVLLPAWSAAELLVSALSAELFLREKKELKRCKANGWVVILRTCLCVCV